MKRKTVIFLIAAVLYSGLPVSACLGPTNVEGVAFTNGEKINFDSISALGTNGVNYKVVLSDRGGTTVSYPSHYDSKVMVFFGNIGTSFQQDIILNCFGLIYPLSEEILSSHTSISKEVFDFTAAVKAELEWLSAHKIIVLDNAAIHTIVESLKNTNNGGMQYWTLQKNALAYNSWYTYDTINGTWGGGSVNGINSVKSVNGVNGCSGIEIPALTILHPVSVKEQVQQSETRENIQFTVSGRRLNIQGLQANQHVDLTIISTTGEVINSFSVKGTFNHQIELGNIVPGTYLIRMMTSGAIINKSVVVY
jgi:hypothetical protein